MKNRYKLAIVLFSALLVWALIACLDYNVWRFIVCILAIGYCAGTWACIWYEKDP